MKVSVCIITLNEEKNILILLESLLKQTKKPSEIVIVDGGSSDGTVKIVRSYQKKCRQLKLHLEKCSRAKGRNIAVRLAKNNIIAMTDAGCVVDKNWLKEITEPFKKDKVEIVAGFYSMRASNALQKAMTAFLGILPSQFDKNFLPSTRSIAFTKKTFAKVDGFEETLPDAAEDTLFNYRALKRGIKITRVKTAIVEWGIPKSITGFTKKTYFYAKGDAKSKIWKHSLQGYTSHNIKVLFVFLRYLLGLFILFFAIEYPLFWLILGAGLIIYSFWAFVKVYKLTGAVRAGLWGIVLQYASDFAVMAGFMWGFLS